MKQYLDLQRKVLTLGDKKEDRTGTGTISLFGEKMVFDLREGFPLITTKEVNFKHVINELLWFLSGSTDVGDLIRAGTNIWNKDSYRWYQSIRLEMENNNNIGDVTEELSYREFIQAVRNGMSFNLGPIYGAQWRKSFGTDQIKDLMDKLSHEPNSRRLIVSAWNPSLTSYMALPPCHILFQTYSVDIPDNEMDKIRDNYRYLLPRTLTDEQFEDRLPKKYLDLQMYQRSCDLFLGVPYNVSSYSALMVMMGSQLNMIPRFFHWLGGDVHIYNDHIEAVKEQLQRKPGSLPKLVVNTNVKDIYSYTIEDFQLYDYSPQSQIKAPLSVG
tara:strand:+ start:630 stop:1613 length:984 start_codon:yes stop_codon:yes gene_type:complete